MENHWSELYSSDDDTTCMAPSSDLVLEKERGAISYSTRKRLEKYLEDLYEKRKSTREEALMELVNAFERQIQVHFAKNKCFTLLQLFIKSIKRGSTIEAYRASRALGLLAITVGPGDNSHEIMEEIIQHLGQPLKSGSQSLKSSNVLDTLAVATFVGANNFLETERSMEIIWHTLHPKSHSDVVLGNKPASSVLAAAISAWSYLLTTIHGWNITHNKWLESISILSSLLEDDDISVRVAAVEAITLIFEIGSLDKFSVEIKSCVDRSILEGNDFQERFACVEALKEKFLNQVRNLSMKAEGKGSSKDLSGQRRLFKDVLAFLEAGHCPETSIKVQRGCNLLQISTWAQLIQLSFLKRFLGHGFLKHMQENELLHNFFEFTPTRKEHLLDRAKDNDLLLQYLDQDYKEMISAGKNEKLLQLKIQNSAVSKARAQSLNRQRILAQNMNAGHYSCYLTNEEA